MVPHAVLDGGWVPPTGPGKGVPPYLDLGRGYPHLDLGRGYPHPHLDLGRGYPLHPTWTWERYPCLDMGSWYTPPPPADLNRQTPVKTVPSLVLRTRAVIKGRYHPDHPAMYPINPASESHRYLLAESIFNCFWSLTGVSTLLI